MVKLCYLVCLSVTFTCFLALKFCQCVSIYHKLRVLCSPYAVASLCSARSEFSGLNASNRRVSVLTNNAVHLTANVSLVKYNYMHDLGWLFSSLGFYLLGLFQINSGCICSFLWYLVNIWSYIVCSPVLIPTWVARVRNFFDRNFF